MKTELTPMNQIKVNKLNQDIATMRTFQKNIKRRMFSDPENRLNYVDHYWNVQFEIGTKEREIKEIRKEL